MNHKWILTPYISDSMQRQNGVLIIELMDSESCTDSDIESEEESEGSNDGRCLFGIKRTAISAIEDIGSSFTIDIDEERDILLILSRKKGIGYINALDLSQESNLEVEWLTLPSDARNDETESFNFRLGTSF